MNLPINFRGSWNLSQEVAMVIITDSGASSSSSWEEDEEEAF